MRSIDLPPKLERIEEKAFSGCSSLEQIVIPNSVSFIGEYAFSRSSLDNIVFPMHLRILNKGICKECTGLSFIKLSEDVSHISDEAFMRCRSLKTIELPKHLQSIGKLAFSECYRIQMFSIPEKVERIGDCAFSGCSSLKEVFFDSIPKEIGRSIFGGSKSLSAICIPNGSLNQFAKLLPEYVDKLIEENDYNYLYNE